jgi:hypothetical protein
MHEVVQEATRHLLDEHSAKPEEACPANGSGRSNPRIQHLPHVPAVGRRSCEEAPRRPHGLTAAGCHCLQRRDQGATRPPPPNTGEIS